MKPLQWLRDRLASERAWRLAPIVAVVLTLPSLAAGLAFDDFFQRSRARGEDAFGHHPLDIFNFCWDARDVVRARELGIYPWFTDDHARLAFLRPAASFTHWVDYNLWPDSAWLMHAQTLLWYALAVAGIALLYRRLLGATWVAGLAGLLYACDEAHALPVAFVANRNALMALAGGAGMLLAHDRWRRDGWRAGAALGPLCLLFGVLSAEAALGAVAYLASYALFLDRAPWRSRVASLAPYAALLGVWQLGYRALGYHIEGSALYIDPLREPAAYLGAAWRRVILLLAAQLGGLPSDLSNLAPARIQLALLACGVAVLALVGWVVAPLVARDRVTRFFAGGAVMALAPICATFPSDRLLFFVGIGAMGVVAQVIGAELEGTPRRWRWPARALGWGWVGLHLVVAPLLKPLGSLIPKVAREAVAVSAAGLDLADVHDRHVILITSPNFLASAYRWVVVTDPSLPMPVTARVLAVTPDAVEVERPTESVLVVRPRSHFLADFSSALFRSESRPLALGERIAFGDIEAEVTGLTRRGLVREVTFHFAAPLEDRRYRWVTWDGERFVDFTLPPVGGRARAGSDRRAFLLPDPDDP